MADVRGHYSRSRAAVEVIASCKSLNPGLAVDWLQACAGVRTFYFLIGIIAKHFLQPRHTQTIHNIPRWLRTYSRRKKSLIDERKVGYSFQEWKSNLTLQADCGDQR